MGMLFFILNLLQLERILIIYEIQKVITTENPRVPPTSINNLKMNYLKNNLKNKQQANKTSVDKKKENKTALIDKINENKKSISELTDTFKNKSKKLIEDIENEKNKVEKVAYQTEKTTEALMETIK